MSNEECMNNVYHKNHTNHSSDNLRMRLRNMYSALTGFMKNPGSYVPGPSARADLFRAFSA